MKFLSKALLMFGFTICKAEFIISDNYLCRIATIESNGNPNAVGDNGNAIGMYQIHKSAYEDACAYLKTNHPEEYDYLKIGNFKKDCLDPDKARILCLSYLEVLKTIMIRNGDEVNKYTLYVAYNRGYNGAKAIGFNINYIWLRAAEKTKYFRAKQILDSK